MEKISHKARIPGATRSWKIQEAPPAEAPKGTKTCLHLDFELPAASLQGEAPLPPPGLWRQETLKLAVPGVRPGDVPHVAPKVSRQSQERGPGLVSPSFPGPLGCSAEPGPGAWTPLASAPRRTGTRSV